MAESDGLDEAAEQILRVGVTAAAQLAERLAQAHNQDQRDAAARSDREARELAARVLAERRAAAAQLARTRDPRWITTADLREVTDAYATARQWAGTDPAAARDAQQILDQVRVRYGVDALPTGLDPAAETSRGADSPARRAARSDAALLLTTPDVDTRVQAWLAEHPGPLPGLTPAQTAEAVDAHVRAELSQARPATKATAAPAVLAQPTRFRSRAAGLTPPVDLERD